MEEVDQVLTYREKSHMPSKHRGNFCPAIGNTAVFSVCCQQHVCFVLISEFGVLSDLKNHFRGSAVERKLGNNALDGGKSSQI
jgi:hypothetical protein